MALSNSKEKLRFDHSCLRETKQKRDKEHEDCNCVCDSYYSLISNNVIWLNLIGGYKQRVYTAHESSLIH